MSKRAAEDSDSAESSKKVKRDDTIGLQKDEEGNFYVQLAPLKRASVSVFRGKAYVNLREYYTDKTSGDTKPGKKGITLDAAQWASLVASIGPLTKQLEQAESGAGSSAPAKTKKAKEAGTKAKKTDKKPPKKKKKDSDEELEDDEED